ncbi:hypothetical protein LINPERHAP2_LOCUS30575 [Linum perenne]
MVVKELALQGSSFRGHDESETSLNQGNVKSWIRFSAKLNEKIKNVVLDKAPGNAKYTSPSIQKEIMAIIANKVRRRIREEIGDSCYSILVDEAVDQAGREQMSIILSCLCKAKALLVGLRLAANVVRVLEFEESMSDDARYDYDPEFYSGPFPLVFTEVYRTITSPKKTLTDTKPYISINSGAQLGTKNATGFAKVVSENVSLCYKSTMPDDEVWVMLKCGVDESWTKLFTCPRSCCLINHLEVWKDGAYICHDMSVCDIDTGEVIRNSIEIEGTVNCFASMLTFLLQHVFPCLN